MSYLVEIPSKVVRNVVTAIVANGRAVLFIEGGKVRLMYADDDIMVTSPEFDINVENVITTGAFELTSTFINSLRKAASNTKNVELLIGSGFNSVVVTVNEAIAWEFKLPHKPELYFAASKHMSSVRKLMQSPSIIMKEDDLYSVACRGMPTWSIDSDEDGSALVDYSVSNRRELVKIWKDVLAKTKDRQVKLVLDSNAIRRLITPGCDARVEIYGDKTGKNHAILLRRNGLLFHSNSDREK